MIGGAGVATSQGILSLAAYAQEYGQALARKMD